jgi:hypothetical protein
LKLAIVGDAARPKKFGNRQDSAGFSLPNPAARQSRL